MRTRHAGRFCAPPGQPSRSRRLVPAGVTALLLAVPGSALAAQDADEEADRFKTTLDLAFTNASGNQSVTLLTSDLGFTHLQPERYELESGAAVRFGKTDGEKVTENYKGQVDFALTPDERWSPFLFGEVEHDPFKRLDIRSNTGAGARYRFWQTERGEGSLSGAVLYSYENFEPDPEVADSLFDESQSNARLSWRLKGEQQVTETTTLEHVTFYQPVYDAWDDYLLSVTNTARVRVTSAVALVVSYLYERNSTPPLGVGRDDRLLTTGISIEF